MQRYDASTRAARHGERWFGTLLADEVVCEIEVPDAADVDAEGSGKVTVVSWRYGRFGVEVFFFVPFGFLAPFEGFVEFHRRSVGNDPGLESEE